MESEKLCLAQRVCLTCLLEFAKAFHSIHIKERNTCELNDTFMIPYSVVSVRQ